MGLQWRTVYKTTTKQCEFLIEAAEILISEHNSEKFSSIIGICGSISELSLEKGVCDIAYFNKLYDMYNPKNNRSQFSYWWDRKDLESRLIAIGLIMAAWDDFD